VSAVVWALMWASGLTSPNEWPYLFFSGIGADALRVAIVAAVALLARQKHLHHLDIKAMHERHHTERMRQEKGGNGA
jgi:hypothetical protein